MMLNSKENNFEQHMHGKVPVDIHVVEMLLGSTSIAMDRSEMLRFGMLQGLVFILEGERVLWCSWCRQNLRGAYTKCSNAGYGIREEQKLLMARNEGILFSAHHVCHNVLAWIQSAFSAGKRVTGGDNQVVGKISSWKQDDLCPRNSSVQKCLAKRFSFVSQLQIVHLAKRNWDPGILSCILILGTSMMLSTQGLIQFEHKSWTSLVLFHVVFLGNLPMLGFSSQAPRDSNHTLRKFPNVFSQLLPTSGITIEVSGIAENYYSQSDKQLANLSYAACTPLNWIILQNKHLFCSITFSTVVACMYITSTWSFGQLMEMVANILSTDVQTAFYWSILGDTVTKENLHCTRPWHDLLVRGRLHFDEVYTILLRPWDPGVHDIRLCFEMVNPCGE
jgi:hypothetical protein